MFFRNLSARKGFTLLELLIVIAIIGILVSIVLASLHKARMAAWDAERKEEVHAVKTALELYYNEYGRYPRDGDIDYGSLNDNDLLRMDTDDIDDFLGFLADVPVDPGVLVPTSRSGYLYSSYPPLSPTPTAYTLYVHLGEYSDFSDDCRTMSPGFSWSPGTGDFASAPECDF